MQAQELRSKSQAELQTLIENKAAELNELYKDSRTKEVNKTHVFRELKKDIARANTVITELQKVEREKSA